MSMTAVEEKEKVIKALKNKEITAYFVKLLSDERSHFGVAKRIKQDLENYLNAEKARFVSCLENETLLKIFLNDHPYFVKLLYDNLSSIQRVMKDNNERNSQVERQILNLKSQIREKESKIKSLAVEVTNVQKSFDDAKSDLQNSDHFHTCLQEILNKGKGKDNQGLIVPPYLLTFRDKDRRELNNAYQNYKYTSVHFEEIEAGNHEEKSENNAWYEKCNVEEYEKYGQLKYMKIYIENLEELKNKLDDFQQRHKVSGWEKFVYKYTGILGKKYQLYQKRVETEVVNKEMLSDLEEKIPKLKESTFYKAGFNTTTAQSNIFFTRGILELAKELDSAKKELVTAKEDKRKLDNLVENHEFFLARDNKQQIKNDPNLDFTSTPGLSFSPPAA